MSDDHFDRTLLTEFIHTPFGRALAELPIRYFSATLEGEERIARDSGALLVGNHAFLGHDGFVLATLVHRATGRYIRFLGERTLWKIPVVGAFLSKVGAVAGEPDTAAKLLEAGELVGVYPGGVDDAFKTSAERYQLKWGQRAGFARLAIRAKVPILPVAAFGIDDAYTVIGRERWIGRLLLGSDRYDLPLVLGAYGTAIPRRVKQRYAVLAPIDTTGDPNDPNDVERVRAATFDAIDSMLAPLRAADPNRELT
jgi:1-acyl-sn-glycerol-3-phosphate acyltransferase